MDKLSVTRVKTMDRDGYESVVPSLQIAGSDSLVILSPFRDLRNPGRPEEAGRGTPELPYFLSYSSGESAMLALIIEFIQSKHKKSLSFVHTTFKNQGVFTILIRPDGEVDLELEVAKMHPFLVRYFMNAFDEALEMLENDRY